MPTASFPFYAPGVTVAGPFGGFDASTLLCQGLFEVRLRFIGTGLTAVLNINSPGNDMSFSVDGGAFTAITAQHGPGSLAAVTLATGLAEGPHDVVIKTPGGNTFNVGTWAQINNCFVVTGAAPALAYSPGYGPAYGIGARPDVARLEGTWGVSNGNGVEQSTTTYYNSTWYLDCLHVSGNFSGVGAYVRASSACVLLVTVDGVDHNVPLGATTPVWVVLASGLNPGLSHDVRVSLASGAGNALFLRDVMAVGGDLSLPPALADYGDSIAVSDVGSPLYTAGGWPHLLANRFNVSIANRGIGGTTVVGSGQAGQARTADITGLAIKPSDLFIHYGTNDAIGNDTSAGALNTFQAAYLAMLQALAAGLPSTRLWCHSILPRINGVDGMTLQEATRTAYNARIRAAITALGSPKAAYVSLDSFGLVQPVDFQDGVHPNAVGAAKIYTGLARLLAGSLSAADTLAASRPAAPSGPPAVLAALAAQTQPIITIPAGTKGLIAGTWLPVSFDEATYYVVVGTAQSVPQTIYQILRDGGYV